MLRRSLPLVPLVHWYLRDLVPRCFSAARCLDALPPAPVLVPPPAPALIPTSPSPAVADLSERDKAMSKEEQDSISDSFVQQETGAQPSTTSSGSVKDSPQGEARAQRHRRTPARYRDFVSSTAQPSWAIKRCCFKVPLLYATVAVVDQQWQHGKPVQDHRDTGGTGVAPTAELNS
ncbi:UNVERIFIED_CONTAM: hypothetical protein FKN15_073784 [Acipenser sinensis]